MIKADRLTFHYQKKCILRDFDLSAAAGEIAVIEGPSGSGKTTLARILCGHLKPESGRVLVGGVDITGKPNRNVFLVSQDSDLFPWQTVERHLSFVDELHGSKSRRLTPIEVARMMKLEPVLRSYPKALSGGMQKRLALARALVLDPKVLVLDEVFGAQDQMLRQDLLAELRPLWARLETTVLIVSHDRLPGLEDCKRVSIGGSGPQ